MFVRVVIVFLLSFGLLACQATNPYDPVPKALVLKLKIFEDVVRWGDLRKIYAFAKPQETQTLKIPKNLNNVRVTSYEASQVREISPWRWGQSADIAYVLKDRQIVKQLFDQQIWVSDDEGKSWYRDNPMPQF